MHVSLCSSLLSLHGFLAGLLPWIFDNWLCTATPQLCNTATDWMHRLAANNCVNTVHCLFIAGWVFYTATVQHRSCLDAPIGCKQLRQHCVCTASSLLVGCTNWLQKLPQQCAQCVDFLDSKLIASTLTLCLKNALPFFPHHSMMRTCAFSMRLQTRMRACP